MPKSEYHDQSGGNGSSCGSLEVFSLFYREALRLGTEKADRLLTHAAPLFAVERLDLSVHRDLGYSSEMAL